MRIHAIILGVMAAGQFAFTAQEVALDPSLKLLQSNSPIERSQAIRTLSQQRQKTIQSLISTLQGDFPREIKLDAVRVLGEYRATDAVAVLVQNLALEDRALLVGIMTTQEFEAMLQPVSDAIARIGIPAVPTLVETIGSTDDSSTTKKCLHICSAIEGFNVTKFRLKLALDSEKSPERKSKLEAALRSFQEGKTN